MGMMRVHESGDAGHKGPGPAVSLPLEERDAAGWAKAGLLAGLDEKRRPN